MRSHPYLKLPPHTYHEKGTCQLTNTTPSVLITGVANGSIAGELALQLSAAKPALLILTARSESRVEPVVSQIKAKHPDVAVRFLRVDLASLADVRRAARELEDVPTIDHLVAVAGVMVPPYQKTVDGVELQFAVNYLANFLLVKELLPKVRAAGPRSSIVICASSAVRSGSVNFDDVNYSVRLSSPLGLYVRYGFHKIADVPGNA